MALHAGTASAVIPIAVYKNDVLEGVYEFVGERMVDTVNLTVDVKTNTSLGRAMTTTAQVPGRALATVSEKISVTLIRDGALDGRYDLVSESFSTTPATEMRLFVKSIPVSLGIDPSSLPPALSGQAYQAQGIAMTASGGTAPYGLTCSGTGVAGLMAVMRGGSCQVSGTPASPGSFTVTLTATDSAHPPATDRRDIALTVYEGPPGGGVNGSNDVLVASYVKIMDTEPGSDTVSAWQAELSRIQALGIDPKEGIITMIQSFFASPSYADRQLPDDVFLNDVYDVLFGRQPTAEELTSWTAQLQSGITRHMVVVTLTLGDAYRAYLDATIGLTTGNALAGFLNDFYRGFLGRLPDSEGFIPIYNRLMNARCQGYRSLRSIASQLPASFMSRAEYQSAVPGDGEFLDDLFNALFRRGSDMSELAKWDNMLKSYAGLYGRERVVRLLAGSSEYSARINEVINSTQCIR